MTDERNSEFIAEEDAEDYFNAAALVTGGINGLLGPIWTEELIKYNFDPVYVWDLPEVDITQKEYLEDIADQCITPRVIIHNSGIDAPPTEGAKSNFWGDPKIMDVNFFGAINVIRPFWERMKQLEGIKHIIFIGSLLGNVAADHRNYENGFDKPCTYGASKAALRNLVLNLATRGAHYNILVNMLSFSMVDGKGITDSFKTKYLRNVPMGRPIYKEDCIQALSGILAQTYMTGQEIKIFGGYDCW
jgi:NAD(P)-dependent dehydrogenase (short-subunit alcohol dehydrogenase family)